MVCLRTLFNKQYVIPPNVSGEPLLLPQDIAHSRYVLTTEAEAYLTAGSPEVQLFNAVPADGISLAQLKVRMDQDWVCSRVHRSTTAESAYAVNDI